MAKLIKSLNQEPFWTMTVEDCLSLLKTSSAGLSDADVAERKNPSSFGLGRACFTTHPAQQRVGQCLLFLDLAKLGARSVHSLSWPDSVVGVVMALCFAGLFDALFVCRSPH